MISNLTKQELIDLIYSYDKYIQDANNNNRYFEGWFPVCVNEFYEWEYQEETEDEG